MKKKDLRELIDAHLKKKLTIAGQRQLAGLMDSDPDIKAMVREAEKTFRFLEYMRYKQIRKRLQEFDQKENHISRPFRPEIWLWVLLLVSFIGAWFSLTQYLSPEELAKRNFEYFNADNKLFNHVPADETRILNLAQARFIYGEFEEAGRLLQPLAEGADSTIQVIAKWNLMMCHLAREGPGARWKNAFLQCTPLPEHLANKKKKLLDLLNSFFYGTFIHDSESMKGFKPKLL